MRPDVPPAITNRVKREIDRCVRIAKEQFGVTVKPKIVFEHDVPEYSQRVAGAAFYTTQRVYYNPWFLINETDKFLKRTVPHEVAHLVVRKMQEGSKAGWKIDPHGPVFRKVMQAFGVPKDQQSEKHEYDSLVLPQYQGCRIYKCESCLHAHVLRKNQHMNLVENPKRYGCVKCGNDLKLFK